ncbi:uncharacterized protein H6S33_005603 [Morchella sextelata]|uniref:uncharacterized protein n=1 Tax=Morchella sextelata TaxID=1174677 RepID=UPI001D05B461|nr:uncharacterized protein H6S33_005603 [Morchella sextelata]KAH0613717.1 hypothetical protein H6S33_005603 [Morchella sextelata]
MQWVHNLAPGIVSQAPMIIPVCVALTVLAVAATLLRCYVRIFMLKTFGADDWVIVFSAVCSIIYNALTIEQTRWGLGLDLKYRPKVNANKYSEVNFAGRPFYMLGITGFKVSLCLAYIRLVNKQKTYRQITWWILWGCVLSHIGGILVLMFQCKPVQKSWAPATKGTCLPNDITFYVLAANTIFFDICVIILPIPVFLRTQIANRKKVALIGLFALFSFTTVCSVMRMVQIITIAKNGNSTMLVLWGTIEMNVGITTTCIPTLAPLFKYFSERGQHSGKPSSLGYVSNNSRRSKRTMELTFIREQKRSGASAYCAHTGSTGRDCDSEENILAVAPEAHHRLDGIQMKKDFQVEISSAHS